MTFLILKAILIMVLVLRLRLDTSHDKPILYVCKSTAFTETHHNCQKLD